MDHWTDTPNPEFERWWATKAAAGYQYGREALENVRFGFEGAQETRWQLIETCPDNTTVLFYVQKGIEIGRMEHDALRLGGYRKDHFWGGPWALDTDDNPPTHWMPLPDPPAIEQAGK